MKCFVFDIETSGLNPLKDRAVELAVLQLDFDDAFSALHAPFSQLINRRRKLSKRATAIHGITSEMLRDAPPFTAVWDKFCDYISERCDDGEEVILIAHNAQFDAALLGSELERIEKTFPDWRIACSLALYREICPWSPGNLKEVCGALGIQKPERASRRGRCHRVGEGGTRPPAKGAKEGFVCGGCYTAEGGRYCSVCGEGEDEEETQVANLGNRAKFWFGPRWSYKESSPIAHPHHQFATSLRMHISS